MFDGSTDAFESQHLSTLQYTDALVRELVTRMNQTN